MNRLVFTIAIAMSLLTATLNTQASCVILLHGLARSADSMTHLAQRLSDQAYLPVNLGYPSREHPIEELATLAIEPALAECESEKTVSFVTHSLGGILVRQFLSETPIENLHRVVMLGPPNQGSEVVDSLSDVPGFHLINGDAGMQLGTDDNSVPIQLGAANFDVGIIAGTFSINPILSTIIPDEDDGKVSVERTKLEGMRDHLEMDVSHPFIMSDDAVIDQVLHYLENGEFSRKTNSESGKQEVLVTSSQGAVSTTSPPTKTATAEKTQPSQ